MRFRRIFLIFIVGLLIAGVGSAVWLLNRSSSGIGEEGLDDGIGEEKSYAQEEEFRFLVFGDSGNGSKEQLVLADLMVEADPDFVLHTGDLAYPQGTKTQVQKYVLEVYEELFKVAEFYPSLGNHDYLTENANPALKAFELPGNECYYSFDWGNAHFIALDTNTPLYDGDEMINWLRSDLESVKDETLWIFVYFHHPPYTSSAVHDPDLRVQQKLVPIFEEYGVDVVFSGHAHNYERTCRIRSDRCAKDGVHYIVTGGGGGSLYGFEAPYWFTVLQKKSHHFLRVDVSGCGLTLEAVGLNRGILDKLGISKCE